MFNCFSKDYNIFFHFRDIVSLRKHFKGNHFLCEEENCVNEDFTSVFRSEIDLKGNDGSIFASHSSPIFISSQFQLTKPLITVVI